MYVVTKNNPYYPSVKYFVTVETANAQRDEWLTEIASEDGVYECTVTVAVVIETRTVMADY